MAESDLTTNVFETKVLHLSVAVWGNSYCDKLLIYAIRSLMAPGNIPSLSRKGGSKFVISTTLDDQEYIKKSPVFERLSHSISIDFLELPKPSSGQNKYALMSEGHKQIAAHATRENALAVIMCPDTFFSSDFIRYLDNEFRHGMKVLMVTGIRFSEEPVLKEFERLDLLNPEADLVLSGREIACICLPHLHPETQRSDWDNPNFTHFPLVTNWKVNNGDGIIVHSLSWGPLAVDYGSITDHDENTLNGWTIDGDYVFRNFNVDDPGIRYQSDSDAFAYVSLTPEKEQYERPVRNWTKGASLRCSYHHDGTDPLKQRLFWSPVFFHSADIDATWATREAAIQELLRNTIRLPAKVEKFWTHYYRAGILGILGHTRDWFHARWR